MLCHVRWVGSGRPARGPVARRHMRHALVERVGPASNRHMTALPRAAARLIGGGSHHSGWYLNISNFNKSVGSVNKRNVLIYKPLGVRWVDVQAWVNALFHRDKGTHKSLIMRYKTQYFFILTQIGILPERGLKALSSCLRHAIAAAVGSVGCRKKPIRMRQKDSRLLVSTDNISYFCTKPITTGFS